MGTTSARRVVRAFGRPAASRTATALIRTGLPLLAPDRWIPESPRHLVSRGQGSCIDTLRRLPLSAGTAIALPRVPPAARRRPSPARSR